MFKLFKPSIYGQRFLKLHQSSDISPNLATLSVAHVFKQFLQFSKTHLTNVTLESP